ncbi:hypothetical protein TorRG33x02_148910, partial [Trema orientale]
PCLDNSSWFMDSGATNHVTVEQHNLASSSGYKSKEKLIVSNSSSLLIKHIGFANIVSKSRSLKLSNILHVPKITKNLISISQFISDNNVLVEFSSTCCVIKDKATKTILLQGILKDGLY